MIVIPAKYGSSRLPQKNFRPFHNDLSLLQIAIVRCVIADCGPVIVSSENGYEVEVQLSLLPSAIREKVEIHQRPEYLAKDPATILDVLANYLSSMDGGLPDAISVVLPTSPFNSIASISEAWGAYRRAGAPKLLSVSEASKPPFNAWIRVSEGRLGELQLAFPESPYRLTQSTACPATFFSNGCISIYSVAALLGNRDFHTTVGYEMPQAASLDIDFEFEFELAKVVFPAWSQDLEYLQILQ